MLGNDLRDICLELGNTAQDSIMWVKDNSALVGGPEALMKSIRQHGRHLKTYAEAADRKMAVAVFGPSQAGKSTLISSLCKGSNGILNALFSNASLNFLSQVNPEGGNETTGLVTRFSLGSYPPSPDPAGYPVCLRLFSEMDIVKILANTYFAEAEGDSLLSEEEISQRLDDLEKRPPAPGRLTLDDMEDLAEYVQKLARKSAYGLALENAFWGRALVLGSTLAAGDRGNLFSCLWGGLESFTRIYKKLYQALEQLDFAETVFCELSALHDKDAADFGRGKSIIIVDQLNGLLGEFDSQPVSVMSHSGIKTCLPRPELSALTAELHVKVQETPGPFMEKADILDFPGYRAREKFKNIAEDIKKPENLKTCFLRGKVAYLFERYSERKEITAMLLCIGNSVQNNPDLPHVIKPWLESAHGATEAERAGKPITMFLVLTMFDGTVEQGGGSTEYVTRWEKRLKASFLDFFGQHDWPKKWSVENGQNRPFNNIFWLQDLSYADGFLEVDERAASDGADKSRVAHGVKPDKAKWAEDVLNGYLQCEQVRDYIQAPQEAWDAVMKGSDGGVAYLVKHLTPTLTDDLKTNQLLELVKLEAASLDQLIRPFFFGSDKDEERAKKERQSVEIIKALQKMLLSRRPFGLFLRMLQLTDSDCRSVYSDPLPPEEAPDSGQSTAEAAPGAEREKSLDLDILFNTQQPEPDSLTSGQPESLPCRACDAAHHFRRRVELAWQAGLEETASNPLLQRYYGLNSELFRLLILELSQGARRLRVFDRIEKRISEAISYSNSNPDQCIWKQARLAAAGLSSYVNWLGLSPLELGGRERTVSIQGKDITLFAPPKVQGRFPDLPDEQEAYDQKYFQDWCRALMRLMIHNVDFAGQNYDQKENERLGALLKRVKTAEGILQ